MWAWREPLLMLFALCSTLLPELCTVWRFPEVLRKSSPRPTAGELNSRPSFRECRLNQVGIQQGSSVRVGRRWLRLRLLELHVCGSLVRRQYVQVTVTQRIYGSLIILFLYTAVFDWFANMTSVAGLQTWYVVLSDST